MIQRTIACFRSLLLRAIGAVPVMGVCVMLASGAGAQQREDPASVSLAASLHESAHKGARVIANLPAGESVVVLQMRGPYSRVKASAGEGWVLSSRLQMGDVPAQLSAAGEGGGSSWLRSLTGLLGGSSRSRRSGANVTIGTRGLQREDVANAQPNQAAVAQLERYVVSAAAAKAQARAAGLEAVDFAYLDAPQSAQSAASEPVQRDTD